MYSVVGCSECDALWVVEGRPDTTKCRRCGTRYQFDRLKALAETDDEDAARQARAELLAERQGVDDAFETVDDFTAMADRVDDAGFDQDEFLERAGVDPEAVAEAGERAEAGQSGGSRSREEIVKDALREQDAPTEHDVVVYAEARGVPADAAEALLDKLRDAGEVAEDGDALRLL